MNILRRFCAPVALVALLLAALCERPCLAEVREAVTSAHFTLHFADSCTAETRALSRRALEEAYAAMVTNRFRVPHGRVEVLVDPQESPPPDALVLRTAGAQTPREAAERAARALFRYSLAHVYFSGAEIDNERMRRKFGWFVDSMETWAVSAILHRGELVDEAVLADPSFVLTSLDRLSGSGAHALSAFWRFLEKKHFAFSAGLLARAAGDIDTIMEHLEGALRERRSSLPAEYAAFVREYSASGAMERISARAPALRFPGGARECAVPFEAMRLSTVVVSIDAPGAASSLVIRFAFREPPPRELSIHLMEGGEIRAADMQRQSFIVVPAAELGAGKRSLRLLLCNASPAYDGVPCAAICHVLAPPRELSVLASTRESVILTWQGSDPSPGNLFTYRVERRLQSEAAFRPAHVTKPGVTLWEERVYRPGRRAAYRVIAVDSFGNESVASEELVVGDETPRFTGKLEALVPTRFPAGWRAEKPSELKFGAPGRVKGYKVAATRSVSLKGRALKGTLMVTLEQYATASEAEAAYRAVREAILSTMGKFANLKRTLAEGLDGGDCCALRYERDDLDSPLLDREAEQWYFHFVGAVGGEIVMTASFDGPVHAGEYGGYLTTLVRSTFESAFRKP